MEHAWCLPVIPVFEISHLFQRTSRPSSTQQISAELINLQSI